MKYKVESYDEDFDRWTEEGLDMCHGDVLCDECKKDKNNIDNCDFIHRETECKQIAEDKLENLKRDGLKARIVEEIASPHTTKVVCILYTFL